MLLTGFRLLTAVPVADRQPGGQNQPVRLVDALLRFPAGHGTPPPAIRSEWSAPAKAPLKCDERARQGAYAAGLGNRRQTVGLPHWSGF